MIQPFAIGNRMPKDCNSMGELQARIGRSQLCKRLQSSFAIIMRSNYIFQIIIPLAISAMRVDHRHRVHVELLCYLPYVELNQGLPFHACAPTTPVLGSFLVRHSVTSD